MSTEFDPNLLSFAPKKSAGFARSQPSLRASQQEPKTDLSFGKQAPADLKSLNFRIQQAERLSAQSPEAQSECQHLHQQRRLLKSKLRLETLKDLHDACLNHPLCQQRPAASPELVSACKSELQAWQQSLATLYTGELKPTPQEGEIPLRQFLGFLEQKLRAALAQRHLHLQACIQAEEKQQQLLKKAPAVVIPMEKAALLGFSQGLNQLLQSLLALQQTAQAEPAQPLQAEAEALEPAQLEAQLFRLQHELKRLSDPEQRQALQAQITRLELAQQAQSAHQRALFLQRFQRSFQSHQALLQNLPERLEQVSQSKAIPLLQLQQKKAAQKCRQDLQQLAGYYRGVTDLPAVQALIQHGISQTTRLSLADAESYLKTAQSQDSPLLEALLAETRLSPQEKTFFTQWQAHLGLWLQHYQSQTHKLAEKYAWLQAQEHLQHLEQLDSRLETQLVDLTRIEKACVSASSEAELQDLRTQWLSQQTACLQVLEKVSSGPSMSGP